MPRRSNGPVEADQRCRRIADQILAAAALDDEAAQATLLRLVAKYLGDGEIQIVQTAWKPDETKPFVGRVLNSKYPGTCSVCGGDIAVGQRILHDGRHRRAAHVACGKGSE